MKVKLLFRDSHVSVVTRTIKYACNFLYYKVSFVLFQCVMIACGFTFVNDHNR